MSVAYGFQPINEKHSIVEVAVGLLIENPVGDAERFRALYDNHFAERFESYNPLRQMRQSFSMGSGSELDFQITNHQAGFEMEEFQEGAPAWTVRYQAYGDTQSALSIHCHQYVRWQPFIDRVLELLQTFGDNEPSLLPRECILSYLDRFHVFAHQIERGQEQEHTLKRLFRSPFLFGSSVQPTHMQSWSAQSEQVISTDVTGITRELLHLRLRSQPAPEPTTLDIMHTVSTEVSTLLPLSTRLVEGPKALRTMLDAAHESNHAKLRSLLSDEALLSINLPSPHATNEPPASK